MLRAVNTSFVSNSLVRMCRLMDTCLVSSPGHFFTFTRRRKLRSMRATTAWTHTRCLCYAP